LVVFPVKHEWMELADLALIQQSAYELIALADRLEWRRVVLPRPGCGNGGLTWDQVQPLLWDLDDRFVVVTK
jgi:O-acetyl-ADP-ribose deacetylase (regulator of RNase III)